MNIDICALINIFANANHDGKIVEILAPGVAADYRRLETLEMAGEGLVSVTLTASQLIFVVPVHTITGLRVRDA